MNLIVTIFPLVYLTRFSKPFKTAKDGSAAKRKCPIEPPSATIPAGKQKVIRYGTLFAPYEGLALNNGIISVRTDSGIVVDGGSTGHLRFAADPSFAVLKGLEKRV